MSRTTSRVTLRFALTLLVMTAVCVLSAPHMAAADWFQPSQYDSFIFDRLYAADTSAFPEAASLDASGNVYYTWSDYNNVATQTRYDRIYKVKADGTPVWYAGSAYPYTELGPAPSTPGQLFWPCGVAVDNQSRVWIADTYLNRVKRLELQRVVLEHLWRPHRRQRPARVQRAEGHRRRPRRHRLRGGLGQQSRPGAQ